MSQASATQNRQFQIKDWQVPYDAIIRPIKTHFKMYTFIITTSLLCTPMGLMGLPYKQASPHNTYVSTTWHHKLSTNCVNHSWNCPHSQQRWIFSHTIRLCHFQTISSWLRESWLPTFSCTCKPFTYVGSNRITILKQPILLPCCMWRKS